MLLLIITDIYPWILIKSYIKHNNNKKISIIILLSNPQHNNNLNMNFYLYFSLLFIIIKIT